jgi:predicted transcriptional regulator
MNERSILISIRKEYWDMLVRGKKTVEYRKTAPVDAEAITRIICYISGPGGGYVAGDMQVDAVLRSYPEEVWRQTSELGGISKEAFDAYYGTHTKAIAYYIGGVRVYESSRHVSDYGLKRPPMSWCGVHGMVSAQGII